MQASGDSFAGVAFHCYAGSVSNQDAFTSAFPDKVILDRMYTWTNLLKPCSRKCISQNVVELLALLGGTILK